MDNLKGLLGNASRDEWQDWLIEHATEINPRLMAFAIMQQMTFEDNEITQHHQDWWGAFCNELGPDWADRLIVYVDNMDTWEKFEDDIVEPFPNVEMEKDGKPLPRNPMNIEYSIAQLRDELVSLIGEADAHEKMQALVNNIAAS